jgi:hypothetical protein
MNLPLALSLSRGQQLGQSDPFSRDAALPTGEGPQDGMGDGERRGLHGGRCAAAVTHIDSQALRR